jgi:hypothetical protein
MEFYNHGRLHQALGYQAPMAVWRDAMGSGPLPIEFKPPSFKMDPPPAGWHRRPSQS